ncbi:hypothetical protein DF147_26510 [Burkholderia cenocepacia]|nr:hypothetical protein DF147_26510 [Burkholderia cenocepacia]RQV84569.1 hypothetical protein DF019_29360 [Burkholderia cenocepacia]
MRGCGVACRDGDPSDSRAATGGLIGARGSRAGGVLHDRAVVSCRGTSSIGMHWRYASLRGAA